VIKPQIKYGKLTYSEVKNFIRKNPLLIIHAKGRYRPEVEITTILEARKYINQFIGRKVESPALNTNVEISHTTRNHLLARDEADVLRRANLLGDALEILQKSTLIHGIDNTEIDYIYYEILGISIEGKTINVKVSEYRNSRKILWTIVDIK